MSGEQLIQFYVRRAINPKFCQEYNKSNFMSAEQLIQFYVRRSINPILCQENLLFYSTVHEKGKYLGNTSLKNSGTICQTLKSTKKSSIYIDIKDFLNWVAQIYQSFWQKMSKILKVLKSCKLKRYGGNKLQIPDKVYGKKINVINVVPPCYPMRRRKCSRILKFEKFSDYCIRVDSVLSLDIPECFVPVNNYSATLAHKVNMVK